MLENVKEYHTRLCAILAEYLKNGFCGEDNIGVDAFLHVYIHHNSVFQKHDLPRILGFKIRFFGLFALSLQSLLRFMGELAFPLVTVPVWSSKLVPDRHLSPLAAVAMATGMSPCFPPYPAQSCSSRSVTGPLQAGELARCKKLHRVKQIPWEPSATKSPPPEEIRLVILVFLASQV